MDFALPAVILILIFSPGAVFWYFFTRQENVSLDSSPLAKLFLAGLLLSTVLHSVWLTVGYCFGYLFKLKIMLMLLGDFDSHVSEISASLESNYKSIIFYWLTLLPASVALGRFLRRTIEKKQWDRGESWINEALRLDSTWHYLFSGGTSKPKSESDKIDAILIAAIVEFDGKPYLYRGFLNEYVLKDGNTLDRLIIEAPQRRPLGLDKESEDQDDDSRFYTIDGDYFVLRYDEIKTLNVYYIDVLNGEKTT